MSTLETDVHTGIAQRTGNFSMPWHRSMPPAPVRRMRCTRRSASSTSCSSPSALSG